MGLDMPGEVAAWGSTGLAGAREGTTLDATHAASAFTPAAFMIFPADLTTVGAPPPNAFPDPLTVGFSSLAARIQPSNRMQEGTQPTSLRTGLCASAPVRPGGGCSGPS